MRHSAACAPLAGPGEGQRACLCSGASLPLTPPGPCPCCENQKCAPREAEGQAWWGLRGGPGAPTLRLKPEEMAALRPQALASPRAEMFLQQVRRDDRPDGPRAGQGRTHAVCCPRPASASTHSGVRWALPRLPRGDSAHPTVPVFPRWQAALTCPWKCSRSCRQAAGVYHCRQTDGQAGMSPRGAPGQELVAYFPGSPLSPSKPPSRRPCQHLTRLQGSDMPGSPGRDSESWILSGEGSCAIAVGMSHLCPLR